MAVYVKSAAQISIQNPLSTEWFEHPLVPEGSYSRAQEADYRTFLSPIESRRMGRILKRAVAVSRAVIDQSGISDPDAIVTGTGLGCIENTEKFLSAMTFEGEEFLQPSAFINSTHNTISSQIAVWLHCHGYNNTYSHLGISFDSALYDAMLQFGLGRIGSALVSGHDEMTPSYFSLLNRVGFWKPDCSVEAMRRADTCGSMAGETAAVFMLSDDCSTPSYARIEDVELLYRPSMERVSESVAQMCDRAGIRPERIDAVVMGKNGDRDTDAFYEAMCDTLQLSCAKIWYKHLFGESFTASAFGLLTGVEIMRRQSIPSHLLLDGAVTGGIEYLLIMNHYRCREVSLTLLSRC